MARELSSFAGLLRVLLQDELFVQWCLVDMLGSIMRDTLLMKRMTADAKTVVLTCFSKVSSALPPKRLSLLRQSVRH